jgi:hypothetical protein
MKNYLIAIAEIDAKRKCSRRRTPRKGRYNLNYRDRIDLN